MSTQQSAHTGLQLCTHVTRQHADDGGAVVLARCELCRLGGAVCVQSNASRLHSGAGASPIVSSVTQAKLSLR